MTYTNYNFMNYRMQDMMTYNGLGYGSGIPALFNGVDGLSVFSNYGSYGSYGTSGCCDSSSNGWSTVFWLLGAVGIGVAGMLGMSALNNHREQKRANEARPGELQSQIEQYNADIKKNLDILGTTESGLKNFDVHKALNDADTALNDPNTGALAAKDKADRALNDATAAFDQATAKKSELSAQIAAETNSTKKAALQSQYNDLETKLAAPNGELYKTKADAEDVQKQKERELQKAQENYNKAKENDAKLVSAYDALTGDNGLIAKRDAAQKELDNIQMNKILDDADGNIWDRMGKAHFDVADNGTITTEDIDSMTARDIRKLGYRFRTGTDSEKEKIKKFVQDNETKLRSKVDKNSDEETILNSILNS